jgi:hypothetical protein
MAPAARRIDAVGRIQKGFAIWGRRVRSTDCDQDTLRIDFDSPEGFRLVDIFIGLLALGCCGGLPPTIGVRQRAPTRSQVSVRMDLTEARAQPLTKGHNGGRRDDGASAIALLLSLLILGAMAAIVLVATNRLSQDGATTSLSIAPGTTVKATPSADLLDAAARAACIASYEAVSAARDLYTAVNGHPPASISDLQSMLRDPLSTRGYTITIASGGHIAVATPGHPARAGSENCAFAVG